MKTFPLMISKQFLKSHPRAGENTFFRQKIELGQGLDVSAKWITDPKIHTIRGNYDHWARIAEEVNAGRGVLSLRQWTGSPYNFQCDGSKPVEFMRLTKMGVQKLVLDQHLGWFIDDYDSDITVAEMAKNDGLTVPDFKAWFKKIEPDKPMAIIHFTQFRYPHNKQNGFQKIAL